MTQEDPWNGEDEEMVSEHSVSEVIAILALIYLFGFGSGILLDRWWLSC